MMTTRSASRSASSSSWVVDRTHGAAVGPQLGDDRRDELAAGDVDAGGGLVEERDLGPADQGEGERQPLLLARRRAAATWRGRGP